MKKIFAILLLTCFIVILIITVNFNIYQKQQRQIQNFNRQYEEYNKENLSGVDITTLINKAISNNEKNNIAKDENGFYIDGNRNEYRFTAGTLIPVLIRNAQPAYPEITDAEYHDEFEKEKAYWDYEVKLDSNRYVTVRVTEASGKIQTVENEDGLKVYDYDGRYIVNYPYQEKDILTVVSARYNKEEKGIGEDL